MHVLSVLCVVLTAAAASAGPLNPPVGPVASSYKTLTEVEPRVAINATNTPGDADSLFKITQPGSYYLTGNITGVANKHGIEIAASGVTLDLNGFDLVGIPGMGAFDGITSTVNLLTNIEVRSGSVRAWGGDGVDFLSLTVGRSIVTHVRSSSNGGMGIGIGHTSTLTESEAGSNIGMGIGTGHGSTISLCTSSSNGGVGLATSIGCTVTDSTFHQNFSHGLELGNGGIASRCASSLNTVNGIHASNGCTITDCTAFDNGGIGIVASNYTTVSRCTASANTTDGINAGNHCSILENTCGGTAGAGPVPGTAGIHVSGADNRIEGNVVNGNHRGLDVDFSGNLIIRNVASANTINWDISATKFGQFVVAVNSGVAFAGVAGGAPLGNTDPWINFSY